MKKNLLKWKKKNTFVPKNMTNFYQYKEAVARRCSVKKVFLKFCKIHQKTPLTEAMPANLSKKTLRKRFCFVNFAKFLRKPIFIEHIWWLLQCINFAAWEKCFKLYYVLGLCMYNIVYRVKIYLCIHSL